MSWRSVIISQKSKLSFKQKALMVQQEKGQVSVPLEDIAALVIDQPQVTLTAQLLSQCAEKGVAVITVNFAHIPNGLFLPFLPHSRCVKVIRAQLALSVPAKKRLWQQVVRQKIYNQAHLLREYGQVIVARKLERLSRQVRSGDPENKEGQAAQKYFPALFGEGFKRGESRYYNIALNYAYSVVRAALARQLVGHGFLPAVGLHHSSELNAFNLADDVFEPFRPVVDSWVKQRFPLELGEDLTPQDKGILVSVLHQDVPRLRDGVAEGSSTVLAACEAVVESLARCMADKTEKLVMPGLPSYE